ncbi:MAG: hypothetical protein ACTSXG_01875 [Alphaproteobacteria bacterium]
MEQKMDEFKKDSPTGTASFMFYKVKKEKEVLESKIAKLNNVGRPDITA